MVFFNLTQDGGLFSTPLAIFPLEELLGYLTIELIHVHGINAILELLGFFLEFGDHFIVVPLLIGVACLEGEDGILEGDYAIIRRQDVAEEGDIVCALIGEEATLKRFFRAGDRVTLKPANRNYEPMVLTKGDFRILGRAVGVIRKL